MSRAGTGEARGDSYLPTLFDRLSSASEAGRSLGRAAYQQMLLRDLRWLLSCSTTIDPTQLDPYPNVRDSVLNYGIPPKTGASLTEHDLPTLAERIKTAILRFEPRVLPGSLSVTPASAGGAATHNQIVFRINLAFWFEPYPIEFAVRAQWDLDNGLVEFDGGD